MMRVLGGAQPSSLVLIYVYKTELIWVCELSVLSIPYNLSNILFDVNCRKSNMLHFLLVEFWPFYPRTQILGYLHTFIVSIFP